MLTMLCKAALPENHCAVSTADCNTLGQYWPVDLTCYQCSTTASEHASDMSSKWGIASQLISTYIIIIISYSNCIIIIISYK